MWFNICQKYYFSLENSSFSREEKCFLSFQQKQAFLFIYIYPRVMETQKEPEPSITGSDSSSFTFSFTILLSYIDVDSISRRLIISSWISGDRSRKFTNVPWILMIYTPLGAYFFGLASTFLSISGVVTLTYR